MAEQLARLERLVFRDGVDKARSGAKPAVIAATARRGPGRMGAMTHPKDRHGFDEIDVDDVLEQLAELLPELERVLCALDDRGQSSDSGDESPSDRERAKGSSETGVIALRHTPEAPSPMAAPDVREAAVAALQSASIADGLAAFAPHLSDDQQALLRAAHLRARALLRALFAGEHGAQAAEPVRGLAPLFSALRRWPPSIPPGFLPTTAKPWREPEWDQLTTWLFKPEPPVGLATFVALDPTPIGRMP